MRESTEWDLVGLAEKDPRAAEAARRSGVRVVSRQELLGDKTIQAIAVESDVEDHATDAFDALTAGKHVHLEKAPAADLDGFRKVSALAARKGLLLQMGYMWRYHPAIGAALEAARANRLGDVYMVRGAIHSQLTAAQRAGVAKFAGGLMFEMAGHLIDPMVRLLGRPAKVTPFLQRQGAIADGMPDNAVAVLEWPRALGVITTASMQPGAGQHRSFEILGTKGTAVVRPIEPPALLLDIPGDKSTPAMPAYKRYVDDFRDLASAIREGRKLRWTAEEDTAVQETLLRASGMMR